MYCGKMSTCFTEVGGKCLEAKCLWGKMSVGQNVLGAKGPLAWIDFYCEIWIDFFIYWIHSKLIKVNRILNWYFESLMKKQQLFFVYFGHISDLTSTNISLIIELNYLLNWTNRFYFELNNNFSWILGRQCNCKIKYCVWTFFGMNL